MKRKIPANERLLHSAEQLFSERGYGNVGINEIIAHADTAKASFYQHFPSKDALCAAWLRRVHDRAVERHEALLSGDDSLLKVLERYFDDLAQSLSRQQMRGCPFTNTAAFIGTDSEKVWQVIEEHKCYHEQFFQRLCERAKGLSMEPKLLGSLLFLLYSGAATESQNFRSVKPIDAAKELLHRLIESKTRG